MYGHQFIASGAQEVGIQRKYLDGELHLVGYALAKWLFFRPQFKVFIAIICAITILMMHGFVFVERTSKAFFHDQSMDQSLATVSIVHPHVAGRVQVSIGIYGSPLSPRVSTCLTAEPLFELVAGCTAVFHAAEPVFLGYSTKLTLESRGGAIVHTRQLALRVDTVKESV